jgi:hypothetical protein
MKRIVLMTVVAAGMLVPSFALVSSAGAENPHDFGNGQNPPGQPGGDPSGNAGCSGGNGQKPDHCNSPNLDFSEGCQQHGSSQNVNQNPHCEETNTPNPVTPSTSAPATATPGQGVAGAQNQGGPNAANAKAAQAAQGAAGGNLPFTGLDTLWLALLGAGLLASGLALWARSWLGGAANY